MLEYQRQVSKQTLSEAIHEYFTAYAKHFSDRQKSVEAMNWFRCHDIAHVVFGCSIDLDDELIVKISSMFGTTAGLGVLRGYRLAESKAVYPELGKVDIILTTLKSIRLVPQALRRCHKMSKRWPWDGHEKYLTLSLDEIRREFGICTSH